MATYAIGDVQGCYIPLQKLLEKIHFDPAADTLWFTGDLVNRGPQSLKVLRFIKTLPSARIVLGNHDLHLLAVARGCHAGWNEDTFQDVLSANDSEELLTWLSHQPLIHHEDKLGFTMVHAGLAANWDLPRAIALSKEIEQVLQSGQAREFLGAMYGDLPDQWSEDLQGHERLRCITNYFTRSRFFHSDGRLELKSKGKILDETGLIPWYQFPNAAFQNLNIIFGHWAALGGVTDQSNRFALDTGCVWGYCLTAMRLEDKKRFNIQCNT